ncbi:fibronectin type III domain-containing protein [Candidatus Saccharibacteria bacterium]|nr:fibronectin type III domain-containing protein [Candidatus Saccharibacteria bacterium]
MRGYHIKRLYSGLSALFFGFLRTAKRTVVFIYVIIKQFVVLVVKSAKPVVNRSYRFFMKSKSRLSRKLVSRYPQLSSPKMRRVAMLASRAGILSVVAVMLLQTVSFAAPDLNDDWDLSVPGDYSYDSGIEVTSGVARLKAQNYSNDASTAALYHFDESGGSNVTDSSSNGNDGTLDGGSFVIGNLNNAVSLNGTTDSISAPDSSSLRLGQQQTIEAWTKFSSAFSSTSHDKRQEIIDKGDYQLYFDNETGKLTYELADSNATTWSQVAGDDINGSWDRDGNLTIESVNIIGTNLYVGLGSGTGDAEVWRWNGTSWTQIGGDGLNNCWPTNTFETVSSMANDGTNLYVGLGSGAGDGEVWMWNGTTWTKLGGDAINGSWQVSAFEYVFSLNYFGGTLYAGLGASANDAEVWSWNGTSWTKIGGDSLNSGWTTNYETVASLSNDGTNLYAGLSATAGDAEVWSWNGTSWTKIGGDAVNSSWADTTYEYVLSMNYFGGNLYAGLGTTAGDGEVWSWNGTSWTQIGGDSLNSGWGAGYEGVYSMTNDSINLYAGLGNNAGDNEVWRWNGTSWTQIGGDGLNSGFSNTHISVNSMIYGNGTLYGGLNSSSATLSGQVWSWNGASWTRIGGDYVNFSWGFRGVRSVEVLQVAGDYLYAGMGVSTAGNALIWRFDGNSWQFIGGQGVNGSWAYDTYETVTSMSSLNGTLYVGLGSTANDAEVWSWNGSTWTQIGGDSLNSGWTTNFEEINSMAAFNGMLYAGLGNSANDAEVWRWNGTNWTKIGGDSLNSGWTTNFERVTSLAVYNDKLVAGLGSSANDAEVWQWNGTSWTKIGGDSLNSGWTTNYEQVDSLTSYGSYLAAGLGTTAGDAEVWLWNGSTWAMIGGDGVNSSWIDGTYERARTLTVFNGKLYAGLGNSPGDGEVWEYNDSTWIKIAGNSINGGWGNSIEEVGAFSPYKGRLYAGTGNTANADAAVWAYGDNGYLQSSMSSFDTNWHHIAATYDGTSMKVYIDGTLDGALTKSVTVSSSTKALLIGSGYGGREFGKPRARFTGQIDELRLSNVARSSFTTKPYATTNQLISPASSVRQTGVWHWDTFTHTQAPSGGTITYRLSNDDGASWLYWDGSSWSTSGDPNQANTPAVIDANFANFPVTFDGMKWQAVLKGSGDEQVALDGVSAQATSDTTVPSANPTNIVAYKAFGGSTITSGAWTNGSSPYFTWDAGTDADAGIYGYCAYLGTDQTADPTTTKGLLGTSPLNTGGQCAFVVGGTSLDLATAGYLASPLTSSNSNYYLNLRSIDKAGNVTASSFQFTFKFDNTPPDNPGFITAPSGFINTKLVEMTWPTSGGSVASDTNSGVAGMQYRIGSGGVWYGDSHSGTGDISDLLVNDGSYTTQDPIDFDALVEGINTVYFRTWDVAGNYTTTYVTATLKINTSGAPSEPNNLIASPTSNTTNSFGFDWDAPTTYVGDVDNITYCYTVNTLPSVATCSYTGAGSTELTVGPYATQPGINTLYVVARDESSNINYANYASATFTANTVAPGIPLNTDIVDVSIKNTSNWRLAITWDPPSSVGEGISSYRIYRSTDNATFSQVGTSSSTTYIDAGLSQQTYYYQVAACDSTNNCGAVGTTVSEYPTGKFTSPATLVSGPSVGGVTTRRSTINWSTDRASDSKIAIGTKSGQYSATEIGNSNQVSAHEIELDNLSPGTTYYYRAKWTDEDGNTGTSQEQTFTTSPAPVIKEASVSDVGLSGGTISFTTKGATKAIIYYGASESFGGYKEINTSVEESRYEVRLDGLSDGTKYFYMISAIDAEEAEYRGNIDSFSTPPSPRIFNLRFQPVDGEPTSTQRVTWQTNVPATSQISYAIVNGSPQEIQNSELKVEHEIIIQDLLDDSEYALTAQSRDADGNLATSDRQAFRTALDTRPPKISDIVVESSVRGSGSEARGQIVVSWRTDEPSTSQVAYTEGSDAQVFNSKTAEDSRLTTEHIVIISSLPTSRVFSVQPLSSDAAANEGVGETQTVIIGRASDSALTVVFNTLKSLFGF